MTGDHEDNLEVDMDSKLFREELKSVAVPVNTELLKEGNKHFHNDILTLVLQFYSSLIRIYLVEVLLSRVRRSRW